MITGTLVAYVGMLLVIAVIICTDRDVVVGETPEFTDAANQAIDLTGGLR